MLDAHTLRLPPDLAAGEYSLTVVVYSAADGTRMRVRDASGSEKGERAVLGSLSVE